MSLNRKEESSLLGRAPPRCRTSLVMRPRPQPKGARRELPRSRLLPASQLIMILLEVLFPNCDVLLGSSPLS